MLCYSFCYVNQKSTDWTVSKYNTNIKLKFIENIVDYYQLSVI